MITPAALQGWTRDGSSPEIAVIVCKAVNDFVNGLPVIADRAEPADPWPETVKLGALMLAARLQRRRNSPNGIEATTEMGVSYVARYDSDISRLLGLDAARPPQIG